MKKLFFFIVFSCAYHLQAQNVTLLKPGRIIFYNTENLFDTINNPETYDEDFLPVSKNNWDTKKYHVKLNHIAKTIAALFDTIQPLVIGLSEVENRKVLEDLIVQPALAKFPLGIIHHDSPDERGIDVAFLYNTAVVRVDFDATLKIQFPFDKRDRTRDILYMKTYINEGEPIWFFVNHWPSRIGGKEASEPKRKFAAKVLKEKIENVYVGEKFARVIAMGDFNDNPSDESILALTSEEELKGEPLVDLMKPLEDGKNFTLRYNGSNDIFDQFIVSKNLLTDKNQYFIRNSEAHIFLPEFLLYNHYKFGLIPNRTYASGKWVGGYSDHLPVYCDMVFAFP